MGPTMPDVNIAVVVGSNRRASINGKLARALARLADRKLAVNFVPIDDLPMYNQDLEVPLPASVARFKAEIERADALLFVTPEHNRSIPAVLKNAIDWGARPYGRNSWAAKPAAIRRHLTRRNRYRGGPTAFTPGSRKPRRLGHGRRGLCRL